MSNRIKKAAIVFFSVLFAATSILPSHVAFAAAEEEHEAGTGVHADPTTFEKNFELTIEQKQKAIETLKRAVATVTDEDMSDLEKYYRLALWLNERATYDHDFWSGRYFMEYYKHQWDSYGVLFDKSVCAGIAITYAAICHAAGLPCKFVRLDPKEGLDHTINYIPNINDNAYLVDVTENDFILSEEASPFGSSVDKEFAHITKDCTDHSFEYREKLDYVPDPDEYESGENKKDDAKKDDSSIKKELIKEKEEGKEEKKEYSYSGTRIKECFETTYSAWFREYALHQGTTKDFWVPYEEKGSGRDGVHYAKYSEYPKQFSDTEKPTYWFLEDFYKDPKDIESKIRNKVLDKQIVKLDGLSNAYEYENGKELAKYIGYSLAASVYPSLDTETGEIVPRETELYCWDDKGDFSLTCDSFDDVKHKAVLTIKGKGEYSGSFQFTVKLKKNNPMKATGKTVTIKHSNLKKKALTIKKAKLVNAKNAKGQIYFKLSSVKKGKKDFKKFFKFDLENSDLIVTKGLKKGTYKLKAKVQAGGDEDYRTSAWKTVTIKVKVK